MHDQTTSEPSKFTSTSEAEHPVWCDAADTREAPWRMRHCEVTDTSHGGFHEGDAIHVAARCYEVDLKVSLVQFEERSPRKQSHRVHAAAPQLRLEIDDRENARLAVDLELAEAEAFLSAFEHQVKQLRGLYRSARDSSTIQALWTLGWQPESTVS